MTVRCLFSTSSYFRTFLRISKFCCSIWRLRRLDRLGDHLRLDRHVLGQPQQVHHRRDPLAVEPHHQVVAEREVEARLARVALTTGAAAQLVVDAARLVPLGAEHVQAAELDDLVVLLRDLGLAPSPARSAHAASYSSGVSSGVRPRSRSAWSAANSGLPPSMMSVPRPAMLVATVTAPLRPAAATIAASRACCLALSTSCGDARGAAATSQALGLRDARGADEDRLARPRAARRCRRRRPRTWRPRSCR